MPASFYRHEQRSVVNPYFVYEFELGFHIESACGLRLLSPYHDCRLVRFLNAVPPEVLLDGARYKGLLRPVADWRLPGLDLGSQRKVYGPGVIEPTGGTCGRGLRPPGRNSEISPAGGPWGCRP